MDTVQFADDVKQGDGGPVLETKKPRTPRVLLRNLPEEERLQKIADSVQARRDYVREYYKKSDAYRAASKERARVFSKSYYHSNPEYQERVKERAKIASKFAASLKKALTSRDCKEEAN
jgi:hypothetical protein